MVDTRKGSNVAGEKDEHVPELPTASVARLGDLFELGEHRIICGDSCKTATYEALLGDERAAMSISDAPYNVSIKNYVGSQLQSEFVMGVGEMSVETFTVFQVNFLERSRTNCKPGAVHYAFMDWRRIARCWRRARPPVSN